MRGLKLVSWSGTSGYALAAMEYLRGLVARRMPVQWVPLRSGPGGFEPWRPELGLDALDFFPALADDPLHADLPNLAFRCNQPVDYDTVLVHLPPEYWPVYFEPGRRNIGFTAWETDRLPPHWPSLLNLAERVLVPSAMNREVAQACGVRVPVRSVPHIVRAPAAPAPERRARLRAELGCGPGTTVFYSINAWEPRKAIYDLLGAYARAFGAADDVLLLLKTSARGMGPPPSYAIEPARDLLNKWLSRAPAGLPPVRLIERDLSGAEIEDLHAAGDVFASLTRGEGWGLGGCDALARGNPVLMTGWGGPLDYLGSDWPWLVNYRLAPVTPWPNQSSFLASQRWAQADLNHAAGLLRALHAGLPQARARAAPAAAGLRERLAPERVTAHLLESIDD